MLPLLAGEGRGELNTMNIEKSGFYKLDELINSPLSFEWEGARGWGTETIYIWENLTVSLFDTLEWDLKIEVWAGAKLQYFSYFLWKSGENKSYNKEVILVWEWAQSYIQSMNYSEAESMNVRIWSESLTNNGRLDTNILSFAWKGWKIAVDGILRIEKETSWNVWELDEENIFLGDDAQISGIPTLYVETNDMEAWHACRVERISDEKLFYLRSRGLGRENALAIMIEAKIRNIFSELEEIDTDFYESLLTEIIHTIQ